MVGDILDLAASIDVVVKSGAWYAYEGNKIGQGRENAKQYLKDNPAVCEEVTAKVRAHFGLDGKREDAVSEAENPGTGKPKEKTDSEKADSEKAGKEKPDAVKTETRGTKKGQDEA